MRATQDILTEARRCLETANSAAYPEDFSVNWWWLTFQRRNLDAIGQLETAEEALLYGLDSRAIPFDHRGQGMKSIIEFKMRELERLFPAFQFSEHQELRESLYCDQATLEDFSGIPYSNIFLWHVNFYLRSTSEFRTVGTIKRVVEIGSGYGGLARIFKIMKPEVCYTLIDLPTSLFFAHIFLSLNFPDARVLYLDDENQTSLGEQWDFILVPAQMAHLLAGQTFDIAINTACFQEMTDDALAYWMNFIERQIEVSGLYSCNYFMKLQWGGTGGETVGEVGNLICPVLDPFWRVKYFRINPEIVSVDASTANYLETYLERVPAEERDPAMLQGDASALLGQANLQPKGSNGWFENQWMAIWRFPSRESISAMLDGIRLFRLDLGATNNNRPKRMYVTYYRRRVVRVLWAIVRVKPVSFLRELRDSVRWRPRRGGNEYSEEKFYRKMLSEL